MTFLEIVVVLILALLFSLVLVGLLGWRRVAGEPPWPAAVMMFLILFLALWLTELWVRPVGPQLVGVYWVPVIVVGLVVVLIAATLIPPRRGRPVIELGSPAPETATSFAFGVFFWLLLILLIASIVAGYGID